MDIKEDLTTWIVDNFDDVGYDTIHEICSRYARQNGWDDVEVDFMVDDLCEVIKDSLLNLVETYEE